MTYPVTVVKRIVSAKAERLPKGHSLIAFGARLRQAREDRHLTMPQVMRMLEHRGYLNDKGKAVDKSQLSRLEHGKFSEPSRDAVLVFELAGIYGLDHAGLLKVLRWNRQNPAATVVPDDLSIEETGMNITGHEERLIRNMRALNNAQQQYVFDQLEYAKTHFSNQTKKTGAARSEGTFHRKRS